MAGSPPRSRRYLRTGTTSPCPSAARSIGVSPARVASFLPPNTSTRQDSTRGGAFGYLRRRRRRRRSPAPRRGTCRSPGAPWPRRSGAGSGP
uniref:Uncharacterized protein n=1 Tax=Arundo donax TaxID=35708 RepID=A0A0A9H6W2_ARUDO